MKIGIYGGSFNPPHLGHFAAARAAARALALDKLLIVPASVPPHKALPAGSPSPRQRLEMAEIFADQFLSPAVECWDVEIARAGSSYTSDTLRAARERWPEAELWLLVGTDMFLSLQNWHEPETIMELAGICAFSRARSDEAAQLASQREALTGRYGARVVLVTIPDLVEISSTDVRAGLCGGGAQTYLLQPVYGYILREKLYGTSADLARLNMEELRCVSYSMVKAKRLAHIRGTEETAAALAERWGADPEKMRRAAILHDCTKYDSLEEHLAICSRYGIALDSLERSAVKLLHAKSGAALAKYVFGQDDEVFSAILYHTTGRGNMTLAEKVLYMADYIEPNRDFPEVETMRDLAFTDLDRAVLMGVELTISEMEERAQPVHPNTLDAETSLRKGLQYGTETK